jgi:hypothetical protein
MSHALPPQGHPTRELFQVADLVAITLGQEPVLTLGRALPSARRTLGANKAARAVMVIALNSATDNLELIRVGKRGGWKRLWVFGPVGRHARLA